MVYDDDCLWSAMKQLINESSAEKGTEPMANDAENREESALDTLIKQSKETNQLLKEVVKLLKIIHSNQNG